MCGDHLVPIDQCNCIATDRRATGSTELKRIIVSIYSSDDNPLGVGELSRRLDGLEWWITDRQSIKLSEETIRVIDTTKWKDEGQA
jgi:hypothetical protein